VHLDQHLADLQRARQFDLVDDERLAQLDEDGGLHGARRSHSRGHSK
jgi:hypothetical protein